MQDVKTWRIGTGARLAGTVPTHGNKNAALPCMAAALLLPVGASLRLDHVPVISDVATMSDILMHYGIRSLWVGPSSLILLREHYVPTAPDIPSELASRIRGSIVLLGALATQYPRFRLAKPGGDRIGGRPITAHLTALADLGFEVKEEAHALTVQRMGTTVRSGAIILTEQSVTATLLVLLASAALAPDEHLTIINAACEPHIVSLCGLLESLGARIDGLYSNLLTIRWPTGIGAPTAATRLDDDFMEAATYAVAAAVTESDLTIPFANARLYLALIDRYLGWMGVHTHLEPHAWHIFGTRSTRRLTPGLQTIKAEPWPRFPTDIMSMFVVLATQCTGSLRFVEYMYDDRFAFVQSLRDIGARIDTSPPHAIVVHGPTPLSGNELFLRPDIRSGAAMLLAALASDGSTVLHDRRGVIARGYQDLPQTLAALGAPIEELILRF
jgi:UDP-N-acetylglucosamine 1-carboxyvinyltransferase